MDDSQAWVAFKKLKQEKRASNRDSSAELLRTNGVSFVERNNGAHLIVKGRDGFIDFWPGTGRWIDRQDKVKRLGVKNLISHVKEG